MDFKQVPVGDQVKMENVDSDTCLYRVKKEETTAPAECTGTRCFTISLASAAFMSFLTSSSLICDTDKLAPAPLGCCDTGQTFFLFLSDTGTTPPESGIFGFMINFSAFLGAATMYTRYKIVEKQNQTSYFSTPVLNLVSLVLGLVGCIGMGIVANFQELAVPVVHDGGALLAFVCGVVYTLLQSIISYKSCPQWNSLLTCHVRMAISAVSCAAVVPSILFPFVNWTRLN
uniref:DNA damage-regulated autophagy modulator protein 1-like n=1 Tax=Castor canadensis TaxID=51338 RepID=A0A8B7U6Q2_CASCN|nr:DNA damage-regulated autophagy modulator protein 1-like [Castor canadensis]